MSRRRGHDPESRVEEGPRGDRGADWFRDPRRRLAVADPTGFLISMLEEATPAQPTPYRRTSEEEVVVMMEKERAIGIVDLPLEETPDELLSSRPLSPEERQRLLIREGPIAPAPHGLLGPRGLDRSVGRRLVACRCNPPGWERRHGPD